MPQLQLYYFYLDDCESHAKNHQRGGLTLIVSVLGISFKNNKEQQELIRLINTNDIPIILCTGNAGTGKTFCALASALQLKIDKKYKHIVFARNPIQMGQDMGSLPGGIDEKYDPFMGPLYDNLEAIVDLSGDK